MKCPVDDATLVMSERSGIEIDYCPQCRGVWLDRGELDKIIERGSTPAPREAQAAAYPVREPAYRDSDYDRRDDDRGYGRKRKRESWLSDLFD